MNALLILIPVSLILLGIAIWAFFWAVNRGQFDDLDTPALRILEDDLPAETGPGSDPAVGIDHPGQAPEMNSDQDASVDRPGHKPDRREP